MFTDSYGEQSCTPAGRRSSPARASTAPGCQGRHPRRAGGHVREDRDDRGLLKDRATATDEFGKNHLGDMNHMPPTNHGFDEFFGNLYHLTPRKSRDGRLPPEKIIPNFLSTFEPRGVIHPGPPTRTLDGDASLGRVGKQIIQDTGPLPQEAHGDLRRRLLHRGPGLHQRQEKAGKPSSSG